MVHPQPTPSFLMLARSGHLFRLADGFSKLLLPADTNVPDTGYNSKVTYSGDGTTKNFPIPFPYRFTDELVVQLKQDYE